MAEELIKGKFVVMLMGGEEIAFQDSCTISRDLDLVEVASSDGENKEYLPDMKGTTVSVSGLIGAVNGELNSSAIEQALDSRGLVSLAVTNETTETTRTMQAYCTAYTEESPAKGYSTFNAQFQVTGGINYNN